MNPLSNDTVTIPFATCGTLFTPAGKRRYCKDACRVTAHRGGQQPWIPPVVLPAAAPAKAYTV